MLSNRQKEAESDKWMALAQTGMALMASKNPTFGGALGEAGLAGIGALQKSKQGARAFETDMLKLQTQLDIAQQRARSSGLKGSNLTLNQMLSRGVDLLKEGNDMLESAQGNADVASVAQGLIQQGQMLINAAGGGTGSGIRWASTNILTLKRVVAINLIMQGKPHPTKILLKYKTFLLKNV
jgi:hypothetical protein